MHPVSAKGSEMRTPYKYYDLVMATFVAVLLISNLLSSAKIIDIGLRLGDLPLSFDAGTLIFPIAYIFGDILTEVYGYKRSRRVIWMGFFAMILLALFVDVAGRLPAEAYWADSVGPTPYQQILGGIPGLIVASLAAYWVGEFANSFVLAKMKVASEGKRLWARTISSTLVGQLLDSVVFIGIATLLGVFPAALAVSLIVTNYILKVGIEVVLTPLTLAFVPWLKRAENEDYYDRDTNFNPFHFGADARTANDA
jgi:queuosine precursor transporter